MKVKLTTFVATFFGTLLLLFVWVITKSVFAISDRYLPAPLDVVAAAASLDPSLLSHIWATTERFVSGLILGLVFGIVGALVSHQSPLFHRIMFPSIQSLRAVPPIASVPFFLLWFGFSETGKVLLVVLGVGLNIWIASYQILAHLASKYVTAMRSFGASAGEYPIKVGLPVILEGLLPALRSSMAITFGAVLVAELLGSQEGLGYLLQTSRSTYAIKVLFLGAIVIGLMNSAFDFLVQAAWNKMIFWKTKH